MKCGRCAEWVDAALRGAEGVHVRAPRVCAMLLFAPWLKHSRCAQDVAVSLDRHSVEVSTRGPLAALLRAVAAAGYDAAPASADEDAVSALDIRIPPAEDGAPACAAAAAPEAAGSSTLLRVRRMSCAACSNAVERAARRVPGVASASASLLAGTASVTWRVPRPLRCGTPADVAAAIRAAGYSADVIEADAARRAAFRVSGMCCAACPSRILAVLRAVKGVAAASLDEEACKVSVAFDASQTGPRALRDAMLALGYGAEPWAARGGGDDDDGAAASQAETDEWRRLFWGAFVFTLPLAILMMLIPLIPPANAAVMRELLPARLRHASSAGSEHVGMAMAGMAPSSGAENGRSLPLMSVIGWVLATPVQFVFGGRFMCGCVSHTLSWREMGFLLG
jgi:hypothetical protein